MSSPLKLKSQTIMNCLTWVLGTELRPLEKQLNCKFRFLPTSGMLSHLSSPRICYYLFVNSKLSMSFIGLVYNSFEF